MDKVKEIPGVVDVTSDLMATSPQLIVDIDRDKASSLGLNAQQVEDLLYSAFGSRQVSTIYTPTNQYFVILQIEDEFQRDPRALSLLYLRNREGKLIPLEAVTKVRQTVGPLTVTHLGQVPATTITFNLAPGYSLSEVTTEIEKLAAAELPATVNGTFQGTAAGVHQLPRGTRPDARDRRAHHLPRAWRALRGLRPSHHDPFRPAGGELRRADDPDDLRAGAEPVRLRRPHHAHRHREEERDHDDRLRPRGTPRTRPPGGEAIFQACLVRFRPIMMTTLAALAGTLPIALGWGAGAESRRTLGLAVVGGLIVSQALTLYITPVAYLYLERLTKYLSPKPVNEIEAEIAAAQSAK
jgi:HAE1 family hydrophobic/amphiphilic exporter-1